MLNIRTFCKIAGISLFSTLLTAIPGLGAERIDFNYWGLEFTVSVAELEAYAQGGNPKGDLATILGFIHAKETDSVRKFLNERIRFGPVATAQMLYSPAGEGMLQQFGQVVRTSPQHSGFHGLRSAFILSAADPDGLTPLNALKKFPARRVFVDVPQGLQHLRDANTLTQSTQRAIAAIEQQAQQTIAPPPTPHRPAPSPHPLSQPGPWTPTLTSFTLTDTQRDRRIPVDVYVPTPPFQANGTSTSIPSTSIPSTSIPSASIPPAPVIILSHGAASSRKVLAYLAEHLASHGLVVAALEHPGSNGVHFGWFLKGAAREFTEPNEFLERPKDVSFLLDALAEKNRHDPLLGDRLDLNRVVAIGQSLGGYTALALAGAPLNGPHLQATCATPPPLWNPSLFLQCRALAVTDRVTNLQDPRIQGAIALNPLTSGVFGPDSLRQIHQPVMILAASDDTVAPALVEQIRPFVWLSSPQKYLAVLKGGTHFSSLGESPPGSMPLPLAPGLIGPDPLPARDAVKALSLAFIQTHLSTSPAQQSSETLSGRLLRMFAQQPLSSLPSTISSPLVDPLSTLTNTLSSPTSSPASSPTSGTMAPMTPASAQEGLSPRTSTSQTTPISTILVESLNPQQLDPLPSPPPASREKSPLQITSATNPYGTIRGIHRQGAKTAEIR